MVRGHQDRCKHGHFEHATAACSSVSWSRTAGLLGMTHATIVPLGAAETGAASSCFRREARLLVAGPEA